MLSSKLVKINVFRTHIRSREFARRTYASSTPVDYGFTISEEVKSALYDKRPLVALESTIITHGMPYPTNYETARNVEAVVRENGAVPATIAIVDGKIRVGLTNAELDQLANQSTSINGPKLKISRRDLAYALSQRRTGGTTVSATMLIAARANINIFATGGCGGVHRGAETSMDISADLIELSRTNVAVVSSGIKSILDIGRSLEYLETHGVPVVTVDENVTEGLDAEFPAFFTRQSGFKSPITVNSIPKIAQMLLSQEQLRLKNGMLVAVPIPQEFAASGDIVTRAIEQALIETKTGDVSGRDVTPYVLKRVNELSKGESLRANMALIRNNARVASQIACEYNQLCNRLRNSSSSPFIKSENVADIRESKSLNPKPVVIGGSIIDFVIRTESSDLTLNGSTYQASSVRSLGGVGRNLADGLGKLGHDVLFISAVGDDPEGHHVMSANQRVSTEGFLVKSDSATSAAFVILDGTGDCKLIPCDLRAHQYVSPEHVAKFTYDITQSPMVVMDANVPIETMDLVASLCRQHGVPLWYEPTDLNIAHKIFSIDRQNLSSLSFASPNFAELHTMASVIMTTCELNDITNTNSLKSHMSLNENQIDIVLTTCEKLGSSILTKCPQLTLLVTLSNLGVALITKSVHNGEVAVEHFKPHQVEHIKSVSGAGDCLTAAVITGLINKLSIRDSIKLGLDAALISLKSDQTVPGDLAELSIKK